jgi:hypothetical protein
MSTYHPYPAQTAQANVPAATVYKREIQKAYTQYGMRTLLALGGWTYRNDFGFLATMTPAQLTTWAQSVRPQHWTRLLPIFCCCLRLYMLVDCCQLDVPS